MKLSKIFWIGILSCVSIIMFFYGVKFLQEETLQGSTFSFKVIYKNAQGIDSGDEVRMFGKKVGYVRSTAIDGQNIICELIISNDLEFSIPIDSKIEITQQDIMGSKIITIFPGKDQKKFILNGDVIAGRNAEVVSLTQDIGDFAKKINDTFGVQQKQQIMNSISNIEIVIQDMKDFINTNKDIITDEDKESFHLIISNFNNVAKKLKQIIDNQQENIEIAVENISAFTLELPELSDKIKNLSNELTNTIENINNGEGTLSKLINEKELYEDALEFINNANLLIVDAKDVVADVKKNPKKWLKAYFAAKREDAKENK
mgnify:CR=1 FL=1